MKRLVSMMSVALFALLTVLPLGCAETPVKVRRQKPIPLDRDKVFESVKASAVDVFILNPGHAPNVFAAVVGAGVIINETGYVLTNSHVAEPEGRRLVNLHDGTKIPYKVVARNNPLDMAIIKIVSDRTFTPAKVGKSGDLIIGDGVMAIGNPNGQTHSTTVGKVTSTAANWGYQWGDGGTWYHDMIATSAKIASGYSGGPLFNGRGELVGISCGSMTGGESRTGFAIPIDRAIKHLPEVLDVEAPRGIILGMTVAGLGPGVVTKVEKRTPAKTAGVKVGDVVTSINGKPVKVGFDFYLALLDRRPGDTLQLKLQRRKKEIKTTVTLAHVPIRPADKVEGLVPGVRFEYYEGRWTALPDFEKLKPVKTGIAPMCDLRPANRRDDFALRFTGYIKVAAEGRHVFYTASDDGSRLWIGDKLVVDNDGLHGPVGKKGYIWLKAGFHRITVAFFELSGGESLNVFYEGPGIAGQPTVPASVLFHAQDQ